MKKAISLLLALVMLCSLLVACGNGKTTEQPAASAAGETKAEEKPAGDAAAQKTTITVLRPGDQDKVASFMEPAVEAFEKENPDIHVEIMYESWPGWIQTYPTYFEADTQPDVIFWWDNKLHDSSANSHLVNLAPYLSDELTKKIPEGVWNLVDPGDMDGLYYIPSSVDTFVLYYNKDVFKEAGLDPDAPPTNWDELLNAAKTIKEKTGKPGIGVPAIDGASPSQAFWNITMPHLRTTTSSTLLVLTVWTFMVFDIIFGMTGGGPVNATKTLPMRIYQEMFGMKNLGTASAWSLIAIGVLVIITILYWNMDKEDKS